MAFAGSKIDQKNSIFKIANGYECWNLKNFSLDTFVEAIKKKIPPVNRNVLVNYRVDGTKKLIFGINENQFQESSWGLLIPDSVDDAYMANLGETIFLLNLYSPNFLYPLFYVSDMGVTPIPLDKPIIFFANQQNQSRIFKTKKFVLFFKKLISQSKYGIWDLYRVKKWNDEDWRLFAAATLYKGLETYDNSKSSFGWQRESADMAAILESLFTAGDITNEEVGYRLRKRIAVLISWMFPDIENDIKDLYKQRSAFVHGSFFSQIAKESKKKDGNLPIPDFGILYKQKEYVRFLFVTYLNLANSMKNQSLEYKNHKTVIDLIEDSIIDIKLRRKIIQETKQILSLMQKS